MEMKARLDWSGIKKLWSNTYFKVAALLYFFYIMASAITGEYATRHKFMNGFVQEIYETIMTIPMNWFYGFVVVSFILYLFVNMDMEVPLTMMVFFLFLKAGMFEPIRGLLNYLLNTPFIDVTVRDIADTALMTFSSEEATEMFLGVFKILYTAGRYLLYVNLSLMYIILPMLLSAMTRVFLVPFFFNIREFITRAVPKKEKVASNIVEFKRK